MNVRLHKKLMELAMELGVKSIGEYGAFVMLIEEFRRGKRKCRGGGKRFYFEALKQEGRG